MSFSRKNYHITCVSRFDFCLNIDKNVLVSLHLYFLDDYFFKLTKLYMNPTIIPSIHIAHLKKN